MSVQRAQLKDISWGFTEKWTISIARKSALELNISLNSHSSLWACKTREFFHHFGHSPNTRVLVKYLKSTIDPTISSLILQYELKENPALVLSYISGIPKPKQCF